MIRIGILGDIGSGKTYIAKSFGYPVFNADYEVEKLYKKDRKIFFKLKKILPEFIHISPIRKDELTKAILADKKNLSKITRVVHLEVRKKLTNFLRRNKNKRIVVLDIPLLLENKINKKKDILIFVQSKKSDVIKRLKKRPNFNNNLIKKLKNIQLPLDHKKRKSNFIIKNDFKKNSVRVNVNKILTKILN